MKRGRDNSTIPGDTRVRNLSSPIIGLRREFDSCDLMEKWIYCVGVRLCGIVQTLSKDTNFLHYMQIVRNCAQCSFSVH